MTSTRLTDEQMAFFDTFGFLSFPGLLADCIDQIIDEFEAIWAVHGGGHHGQLHDGERRSCIFPFPDQSEYLSAVLDDPRIHDIAASICGDDFNYTSGDGNFYAGDTHWHSDGYDGKRVLSIKIAFYLDPLTRDTGALRIIPGSHRVGDAFADALERDIRESGKIWGLPGNEVPALILETTPGDIVVFNHNLKHATFGGSERRRMYTMNFCRRYPEDRLDELRTKLGHEARFWIDRIHGDAMIRTAGPERMVHLKQVMENDTHLAELQREFRQTRQEPSRG
ncbi:MAG: phytanoyl-CoA dioxygenase family protein [Candidatus Poribacteria bacterium]|nr:phytanoyl-CoA dioxygenase family protein [Candidatus Poribacteria bacterium]